MCVSVSVCALRPAASYDSQAASQHVYNLALRREVKGEDAGAARVTERAD